MTKPKESKPDPKAKPSVDSELSDSDMAKVTGGAKPAWAGGPHTTPGRLKPGPRKPGG